MFLEEIKHQIEIAQNTHVLEISDNHQLQHLPDEIFTLVGLKKLIIKNAQIKNIPSTIAKLENLEVLALEGHTLNRLPAELFSLNALVELSLPAKRGVGGIRSLPESFSQLKNLILLNLSNNSLSQLPPSFEHLGQLQELILDSNEFTAIPPVLKNLSQLTQLFLATNKIQVLPDWIFRVEKLEGLFLQNNLIKKLPELSEENHNLKYINLRENALQDIPLLFASSLKELHMFDIEGNPKLEAYLGEKLAHTMNPSLIFQKVKTLKEKEYESKVSWPLHQGKIVILGDSVVGKSSIVRQLLGQQTDAVKEEKRVSIHEWNPYQNADRGEKQQTDGEYHGRLFWIWDFDGQAINHAIHQLFLTTGSIYIIVVNSREEKQEIRLKYWLNVVRSYVGREAPVIVVINKIEDNHLFLDQKSLKETYRVHKFIEISSKAEHSIRQLAEEIKHVASGSPAFHEKVKLSWKRILYDIPRHMSGYELEHDDFKEICKNRDVENETDLRQILKLMHEVGVTYNHRINDDEWPVILDPNLIAKKICDFESHQITQGAQANDGIIDEKELREILTDIRMPDAEWGFLKILMIKNDLCHEIKDTGLILIELLPVEEPPIKLDSLKPQIEFVYQYNFLPENILHRFVGVWLNSKNVREQDFKYWRYGLFSVEDGLPILLKIDATNNQLNIVVSEGEVAQRQKLLRQIQSIMEQIHDRIAYLFVKEFISIPQHQSELYREFDKLLVPYDHLLWLQMNDQSHFFPYGGTEEKSVIGLLEGLEPITAVNKHVQFLKNMQDSFSIADLEGICFELGIDHEDIEGHRVKSKFIRNLFSYIKQRGRFNELAALCFRLRPEGFDLPEFE
jgi:small GTP-binding protein